MTTKPPKVDAVIVGLGWAGGIIAAELTRAGLSVVALERGEHWDRSRGDFEDVYDEMDVRRKRFMQDVTLETWTFRHDRNEQALPLRQLGAFTPGSGVGGSSLLYGGLVRRYAPWDFTARSDTIAAYGRKALPEGTTLSDWGISYDELEPYYERFEQVAGVSGKAGNLRGTTVEGGNPFEGSRGPFPLEPGTTHFGPARFAEAAQQIGLHPFPVPMAAPPRSYRNPYGIEQPACTECGFCFGHPCRVGAKGDASSTVIAAALATERLEIRARSYVFGVEHDGRKATGVRYHDESGDVVQQEADMVILTAYALGNTRLLLMSGMGQPYDPADGTGTVGKNYSTNFDIAARVLYTDDTFRNYMGATVSGMCVDDFVGGVGNPLDAGFLGGGSIFSIQSGSGAIARLVVPEGTPAWGVEWKQAIRRWYDHDVLVCGSGQVLPYRDSYLDLDPTYRDRYGHPLLRITFDWKSNERKLASHLGAKMRTITDAMGGAAVIGPLELDQHFNTARYQSTHNTGGAIMGSDPSTSVVDPWLRMWDYDNVWVVGGSAIPQGSAPGPTGTIGALAYRAVDGILRNEA